MTPFPLSQSLNHHHPFRPTPLHTRSKPFSTQSNDAKSNYISSNGLGTDTRKIPGNCFPISRTRRTLSPNSALLENTAQVRNDLKLCNVYVILMVRNDDKL